VDYEAGEREALVRQWPEWEVLIDALTKPLLERADRIAAS
jgi:hypothetical protein